MSQEEAGRLEMKLGVSFAHLLGDAFNDGDGFDDGDAFNVVLDDVFDDVTTLTVFTEPAVVAQLFTVVFNSAP